MAIFFRNLILVFFISITSSPLYAQKDVTQFLGIPVDGYKPQMIQQLKAKGFTVNQNIKDALNGEFNGQEVNVMIGTNNNKVWRIMVTDANGTSEGNIRIRFNNLLRQFQNSKNYLPTSDDIISKYTISEDEKISYEIIVNDKRYEAIFFQKTKAYDSLSREREVLLSKETLTDVEREKLTSLITDIYKESLKSFDKPVWFMINQMLGKYYITLFYENKLNQSDGEDL
ncbi:MAG: hypothetical protein J5I50_01860 [Chitinophagaceae bacterium]|nr:hypothetical protein [Chitinophagaceae bacterium]